MARASEIVAVLQESIDGYGDRELVFPDWKAVNTVANEEKPPEGGKPVFRLGS